MEKTIYSPAWQAIGSQGTTSGKTPMEAAEAYYTRFPNARKSITIIEAQSYTLGGIPMIQITYNGKERRFRNITKANYRTELAPPTTTTGEG